MLRVWVCSLALSVLRENPLEESTQKTQETPYGRLASCKAKIAAPPYSLSKQETQREGVRGVIFTSGS